MSMAQRGDGGFTGVPQIDRIREAANLNAATNNTAYLLEEQQRANQLAAQQNMLLAAQTQLASEANAILDVMSRALVSLDRTALETLQSSLRQEAIQRERLDLQRKQYSIIERERDLKELMYQMEKFGQTLDRFTDPVAKGYWATQQLRQIKQRGFSTKDIADLSDKRLFDQLLAKTTGIINAMSEADRSEIEQYMMAQSYLLELSTPVETTVPPVADEIKKPEPPEPPVIAGRSWEGEGLSSLAALAAQLSNEDSKANTGGGKNSLGCAGAVLAFIGGIVALVALMPITSPTPNYYYPNEESAERMFGVKVLMVGIGLLAVGIVVFRRGNRAERQTRKLLESALGQELRDDRLLGHIVTAAERHRQAQRCYEDQLSEYQRRVTERGRQIRAREEQIKKLKSERQKERRTTAQFMNAFAKVHPDILRPRVPGEAG